MKLLPLAAGLALALTTALPAAASSHREAPFITEHPKVDGTDFYLFRSYEPGREGFITLIANYQPLQDSYGGPNYFALDPEALYEIHVDNNGDAVEDISFQFRFQVSSPNAVIDVGGLSVPVPLLALGTINGTDPDAGMGLVNRVETYSVGVVRGPRRAATPQLASNPADAGNTTFRKPLDNIGEKTFANYTGYADSHVFPISVPGCAGAGRVFVGQRREGFRVALGEVFDLVNLNPLAATNGNAALDDTGNKSVTSIALELPIACLTNGSEPVIGAWTTASLRRARTLNATPGGTSTVPNSNGPGPAIEGGAFVQVSRLSTPLVNEVVIGLGDKDRFNASHPTGDGQFATYVTHPTLPELLEIIFGGAGVQAPNLFPRTDLVAAALTGFDGLNQPANVRPAEMMRLNTTTAAAPAAMQNRFGVIEGDFSGFPNGRRPGDDVVDILLRVMLGKLLDAGSAPSGQLPVTDGVEVNASQFLQRFPYLQPPLPGARLP
jgi:hypothetical protein